MRELCDQGVAAAQAAKLAVSGPQPEPASSVDAFQLAKRRIVEAACRLEPGELEAEVRAARTLSSALEVVQRVFMPAMAEVGRAWERGAISVAHEHLASDVIVFATREMLRSLGPARPRGAVVLACFADEDHALPLYAAALWFADWGYFPHVLGARLPPSGLAAAVARIEPVFVGLSLTIAPSAARARELLSAYAEAIGERPWAVGGAAASALSAVIEARGGRVVPGDANAAHALLSALLP
jgi:methanogenic corrinoid protein MtbC1